MHFHRPPSFTNRTIDRNSTRWRKLRPAAVAAAKAITLEECPPSEEDDGSYRPVLSAIRRAYARVATDEGPAIRIVRGQVREVLGPGANEWTTEEWVESVLQILAVGENKAVAKVTGDSRP